MTNPDLVVFSHLRWKFVFQRPQHLMVRFARDRRVFFVEEPIFDDGPARLELTVGAPNVTVATPHLPIGARNGQVESQLRHLVDDLLVGETVTRPVLWLYTPMMLPLARHIVNAAVVYDCMDELSTFLGAPPELLHLESELLSRADLVFTGGQSLYEAKKDRHPSVHAFPSSVDAAHFATAKNGSPEPADQASIPSPRIGFFGVVDERLDRELLAGVADARPSLQFVIVGPVVKIDEKTLPRRPNLHWLGQRTYAELPGYLAGWQVAMMPFAMNEATRYISPTKTLEYLAAGKPIVSTPIRDVVSPYGESGIVHIADTVEGFAEAIDAALLEPEAPRLARSRTILAQTSWDRTQGRMAALIEAVCSARSREHADAREEASCTTI
jgi:glycosyltransferase involved in cell wall biosynthesis